MGSKRAKDPEKKKLEKVSVEEKKPKKVEKRPKEKLKSVVRVAGTDLDGNKPILYALQKISGISHSVSNFVCAKSGVEPDTRLGSVEESKIEKIEEVIKNIEKFGMPSWLTDRRKDLETGEDKHITGSDQKVVQKFDVKKMIDKRSYKGSRHMLGLPVRGQRTKSSFRKGKTVGVVRKSVRLKKKQ